MNNSSRKITLIEKLRYLLSHKQKRQLLVLSVLLLVGMLFEMASLGILIPALGLMLKSNIGEEFPILRPLLKTLGNPTQVQLVLWGMSILVFVYLIKAIFLIFLSWRQSKFSFDLSADMSKELFFGYLRQPYTFHLQRNSAELLRNIQSEINQFTNVSMAVISLTLEFSVVMGVAFILIIAEPLGAIVVTSILALAAFVFHRITKNKLIEWGERRQIHVGLSNQHLLQGLGGVKDIKLMGREDYFLDEFSTHMDELAKVQVRMTTLSLIPRLYLELLAVAGLAGLIVTMVIQNKPLDLLLPILGVFVAAAFRMIPSVNRIMGAVQSIRYTEPVVNVLYDEFKLNNDSRVLVGSQPIVKLYFNNRLQIKELDFHYLNANKKALDRVSFEIKKGESIGFIGPSGSGKSTLVDAILGLLAPDKGEILVDGYDIQKNLRGWQDQIGYVPQSIYLTDDTLRRNVAFGIPDDQIDNTAVERAINAAQLVEFVESLSDGLETFVGERGVRLSGGQRQRIGIARALYHDPAVLVLDEATSALDSATERSVMEAVSALQGDKTILIVAHRLSTLENCDKIYKINNGKILDQPSLGLLLPDLKDEKNC
ncbi:MAG: ABC transporter ATP-binding protein [Sediminibacterium sp.]|nr:ABC transporter ATP-binding protein [Sediminibacterium sp.]